VGQIDVRTGSRSRLLGRRRIAGSGPPAKAVSNPHPVFRVGRMQSAHYGLPAAPGYLIRDQDGIYGAAVRRRLRVMGIRDKPIAPGSPWQNGYAERVIGTIRRECLAHLMVFGEAHLRRILGEYAAYYHGVRTHRGLTRILPSIGLFRASAQSHPDPFSAAFITNITESSFRHTQGCAIATIDPADR